MGIYLNPGNAGFQTSRAGRYVDKSGLIAIVNDTIGKREKLSCVSRARRFGKSMAAQMLCAYYDRSCDSSSLFEDLEIAGHPSYQKHLNQYNVIYLDITSFIGFVGLKNVVRYIDEAVQKELKEAYPQLGEKGTLMEALGDVVDKWDKEHLEKADKDKPKYYDEERCLKTRLRECIDNHLRFLTDFRIDFTNNLAERRIALY